MNYLQIKEPLKKYLDTNITALKLSERTNRICVLTPYIEIINNLIIKEYTSIRIEKIIHDKGYK